MTGSGEPRMFLYSQVSGGQYPTRAFFQEDHEVDRDTQADRQDDQVVKAVSPLNRFKINRGGL